MAHDLPHAPRALPPAPSHEERAASSLLDYLREHAASDVTARAFLDTLEGGHVTIAELAMRALPVVLDERRHLQKLALRYTEHFGMPMLKL
jgi:hypothetical protein